ncbi:MAG: hypothetical protein RL291_1865 [Pseudomonadota bacterium]
MFSSTARRMADYALILLVWPVLILAAALTVRDVFTRYLFNTVSPLLDFETLPWIVGVCMTLTLPVAFYIAVAEFLAARGGQGDSNEGPHALAPTIVTLLVGLALFVVVIILVAVPFPQLLVALPAQLLPGLLGEQVYWPIYFAGIALAAGFGSWGQRVVGAALTPVAVLAGSAAMAGASVMQSLMAAAVVLLVVLVVCLVAGALLWRVWPMAVAGGVGSLILAAPAIVVGLTTPAEVLAIISLWMMVLSLLLVLVLSKERANFGVIARTGAREVAAVVAALALLTVVNYALRSWLGEAGGGAKASGFVLIVAGLAVAGLSIVLQPILAIVLLSIVSALLSVSVASPAFYASLVAFALSGQAAGEWLRARRGAPALMSERGGLLVAAVLATVGVVLTLKPIPIFEL